MNSNTLRLWQRLYEKEIIMKYMMLALSLIGLAFASCDKDEQATTCYSFDIRQCQTDEFASEVPETDPTALRESKMKTWLQDQGYKLESIKLLEDFHDAVCEACDVCPQGDRYYIEVEESDNQPDAEELRLLNFEETSCGDAF